MNAPYETPSWNLEPVYPSFDSPEYQRDAALLGERIRAFSVLLEKLEEAEKKEKIVSLIRAWEIASDTEANLYAYASAVYTADTRNGRALAEINALETAALPLRSGTAALRKKLAEIDALALLKEDEAYRFFIEESVKKARFQMAPEMEDLAADLARSGADAWERLHEAVCSTAGAEVDGKWETANHLRSMAFDGERNIREKAYNAELKAWKNAAIPLAAALNGVKGAAVTLDARRGWDTPLGKSAFQSRISEKTLAALIETLENSLPLFRKYLKRKAELLGIPKCAFYDLFAPVGQGRAWSFDEGAAFIVKQFSGFDPSLGLFAQKAFDEKWIDAAIREGKVGGAYCEDFPLAGVSRILCNFDGSFDGVITIAHELGHAWHHEVIKDLSRAQSQYPMTLAETASVFAETVVFEGACASAKTPAEKLFLIEGNLKDCCQVIVDILSRFYFEKSLFEERAKAEVPPDRLCALMIDAQKKTYGDALDENRLHPYMWAVKSHYYRAGLGFYNYPYAFGQLFSFSLYEKYREDKAGFAARYRGMLRLTGRAKVEDAARFMDCDIENGGFWQKGMRIIAKRIDDFEQLSEKWREK
jgi:pepF/M3 family oligoendopeptidase